jgi:hypothetical protein
MNLTKTSICGKWPTPSNSTNFAFGISLRFASDLWIISLRLFYIAGD